MKKIPKILLIVGAISLALSIVFWHSYSMLTDKALYEAALREKLAKDKVRMSNVD